MKRAEVVVELGPWWEERLRSEGGVRDGAPRRP